MKHYSYNSFRMSDFSLSYRHLSMRINRHTLKNNFFVINQSALKEMIMKKKTLASVSMLGLFLTVLAGTGMSQAPIKTEVRKEALREEN